MTAPVNYVNGLTTTDGTEQFLLSSSDCGVFQFVLDTSNMANGDSITLRYYRNSILFRQDIYIDPQAIPIKMIGPVGFSIAANGFDWSIQRTAGVDQGYPWIVEYL